VGWVGAGIGLCDALCRSAEEQGDVRARQERGAGDVRLHDLRQHATG
jgi:hypothetical protein